MADERDPERDQPLPKPGKLPVQQILIHAIEERREHGIRKYGRALETDNGRNALQDAWEEALDLLLYLTQARLERGDVIPGMERLNGSPEPETVESCKMCNHDPHVPGRCPSKALNLGCGCLGETDRPLLNPMKYGNRF